MIKMNMPFFDESIDIKSCRLNILLLRDKTIFAHTAFTLVGDYSASKLHFFDSKNYGDFQDFLIINSLLDFDANSAKIIKLLYENLERKIVGESVRDTLAVKFYDLQTYLSDALFSESSLDLTSIKEFAVKDVLKFYNIKINWLETENFREVFYKIIDITNELLPDKMLVFINLSAYFSSLELDEIASYCSTKNICILLIENSCDLSQNSNTAIFDLDEDMFFTKNNV